MLKGHVFQNQIFGNQIFALFADSIFNGECGIYPSYKNEMAVTYSGNTVTVSSGVAFIKGRPVEEDLSTSLSAGTDAAYCRLVIEIDLDKTNTASELNQVAYNIVKGTNGYPSLAQTDIVNNVAGIYQFELAKFRNTANGITDFQDVRKFINIGNIFVTKTNLGIASGTINLTNGDGNSEISYPSGFDISNCVVLSVGMGRITGQNPTEFNLLSSRSVLGASLYDSYIKVNAISPSGEGTSGTVKCQVILMKTS